MRCTIASVILCSVLFSFHDSKYICVSKFFGKQPKLYITDITEDRVGLVNAFYGFFFFFYTVWHMQLKINFRCIGLHGKKEVGTIL